MARAEPSLDAVYSAARGRAERRMQWDALTHCAQTHFGGTVARDTRTVARLVEGQRAHRARMQLAHGCAAAGARARARARAQRDEVHGAADEADGQRVGARVEGDVKGLAGEDEVRRHAGLVRRVRRVRRRGGGCRRTRSTRRHSARTAMLRLR